MRVSDLDCMEGHQFETYCADVLKKSGFYDVHVTPATNDYGIDIVAKKSGTSYAIQCKCYSKPVGVKAVQEAYAGKSYYNCDKAVVLTNNYFTKQANAMARKNHVELWDREELERLIGNQSGLGKYKMSRDIAIRNIAIILTVLQIVIFMVIFFQLEKKEKKTGVDTTQETEYTPLSDFEYDIENGEIHIDKYRSNDAVVNISPTYIVDGEEYKVTSLGNACFYYYGIKKIIIPNTVTSVEKAFLNDCDAEILYLPASVKEFPVGVWSYAQDIKSIYYEGNEEDFFSCVGDYWAPKIIETKTVKFNATVDDALQSGD